jgi:hypothetical protein
MISGNAALLMGTGPIAHCERMTTGPADLGRPTAIAGVITSAAAQSKPNHNTAIGYADFADGQGVNTTPNTIELTYILYGDANLDGQVNGADLQILLANLNRPGAWDQGDFNYDGNVNSADLQTILFNFNTSLGNQTAAATFAASGAAATGPVATSSLSGPASRSVPSIQTKGSTDLRLYHPRPAKRILKKQA